MPAVTVSILIPAYNAETTLARCVDSALAQTLPGCEIIIVDDGSHDRTGVIADQYTKEHSLVRVVHKANAGAAEARRTAIEHATGEYVMFLDSDDTLTPDAAEFLYGMAAQGGYDVVYGSYIRIIEGQPTREIPLGGDGQVMTGDDFCAYSLGMVSKCANWGCVSRLSLWQHDVFPPAHIKLPAEDVLCNVKLSRYINHMVFLNHPVYNYCFNPSSMSVTGVHSNQKNWETFYLLVEQELKSRGLWGKLRGTMHQQEIDRMAFYIYPLDTQSEWVQRALAYRDGTFSAKTKLLQHLLHTPRLCHALVNTKRWITHLLFPRQI